MNKIYRYILGMAAMCVAAGCTSGFEGFNTQAYSPEKISPAMNFPQMIDCLASAEENPCQRNNTFWAVFGGYVTPSSSWSRNTNFWTYNIDEDWNKWTADWYYSTFYPPYFKLVQSEGRSGYYYQMAQLLRVYVMQMVASLQGPLPYTQVKDGDIYVGYDDETTAWHAMFDDLDAAILEINAAAVSGANPLSSVDRVYYGDNAKWLKFANTLKLRMAMRISSIEPGYAQQKAEEAVAMGVMTSASESAYDHCSGRYPNGYYQVSTWAQGAGEVRPNACITSYMNGYNDGRRDKYFTADKNGGYTGVRMGAVNQTPNDYVDFSMMIYSKDNTTPMPIMYAAEAAFLRAEGALKGWNMGGTAQQFYEDGIRLSFAEWGASGADAYIADATSTPGDHTDLADVSRSIVNKSKVTIAWADGDNDDKKLERIITQKWIALYPLSLEAWCDFRRTGYPYFYPTLNNLSNGECSDERGQRRLHFSQTEYLNNEANVKAAVQMLGAKRDGDGVDLWWALQSGSKY